MSHYTNSPLHVEPIGKRNYRLLSPIVWQLQYGDDAVQCVIPAGFTTDYDSTPWYARPFLRGRHLARKAHALHDWFYNRGWVRVYDETDSPFGYGGESVNTNGNCIILLQSINLTRLLYETRTNL